MIMMMIMMMTMMTNTIPYRRTKTHIWDKVFMGIWVHLGWWCQLWWWWWWWWWWKPQNDKALHGWQLGLRSVQERMLCLSRKVICLIIIIICCLSPKIICLIIIIICLIIIIIIFVCHRRLRGGSIASDVVVNMVHYYCKNDENEAMMAGMETLENDASLSQKILRWGWIHGGHDCDGGNKFLFE